MDGVSDSGLEIFWYHERAVYGYMLAYREFMDLKTGGTCIFSDLIVILTQAGIHPLFMAVLTDLIFDHVQQ